MGLYKICKHKGRARDRCDDAWWGSFRGTKASLGKWANREIRSKAEAQAALETLRAAIRAGTFDKRGHRPPADRAGLTFQKFSEIYAERYVAAKALKTAGAIEYRLKPLRAYFGQRTLGDMKTADIEDFVADLKKPRTVNRQKNRTLSTASINRSLALLRHMLNWAVAREHLEKTPFRRGGEALIRLEREDKGGIADSHRTKRKPCWSMRPRTYGQ